MLRFSEHESEQVKALIQAGPIKPIFCLFSIVAFFPVSGLSFTNPFMKWERHLSKGLFHLLGELWALSYRSGLIREI